ncbi:hypothetical protein [Lentzea sp. E54]|uniref:hypothetical protein n=1 Tax=Lentzea xerophila TaxID=3435883 RepID=UPI003DA3381F
MRCNQNDCAVGAKPLEGGDVVVVVVDVVVVGGGVVVVVGLVVVGLAVVVVVVCRDVVVVVVPDLIGIVIVRLGPSLMVIVRVLTSAARRTSAPCSYPGGSMLAL